MSEPTPAQQSMLVVDEAVASLGRLRQVWPWLAEARLPGVPGTAAQVQRRHSPAQARAEDEMARKDRQAKFEALRSGTKPIGPHPDAARIAPIRARSEVATDIRALAERLLTVRGERLPAALPEPSQRRSTIICPWCAGTGRTLKPDGWAWAWPAAPITCCLCGGYGGACGICQAVGPCHCDLSDAVMVVTLSIVTVALRDPLPIAAATDAARTLARADATARQVLGLTGVDYRDLHASCPACDRRDLVVEVSSPRPQEWSVLCRSRLCECGGPGCGCGRPVRWKGRRHRWPAREFADLADLLGVTLPMVEEAAA